MIPQEIAAKRAVEVENIDRLIVRLLQEFPSMEQDKVKVERGQAGFWICSYNTTDLLIFPDSLLQSTERLSRLVAEQFITFRDNPHADQWRIDAEDPLF